MLARILGAALSLVLVAAIAPAGVAAAQRQPDAIAGRVTAAPLPAPPGRTTLVSQARAGGVPNNRSSQPSMSADARFIAYASAATDIVNGKPSGATSVYVLDRRTGRTDMAPVLPDEQQGAGSYLQPSISDDGRWVAFMFQPPSFAGAQSNPYIALWDRQRDVAELILVDSEWINGREPAISADGRYIAFTTPDDLGEDDGDDDVVRWDRRTTEVVLVSVGFDGGRISGFANSPSISGNGNAVAFVSDGGDSVVNADTGPDSQVYVRNIAQARTTQVSAGPDGERPRDQANDPAISRDGRYVAFASESTNLTPEGAGGLFRHDRQTGRTVMVSVTPNGQAANGANAMPSITSDGAMVAWASTATNMVPETAGGFRPAASVTGAVEVFIRDIAAGETVLISVNRDNQKGGSRSLEPVIDGIGRYVAFSSLAVNLVANDDNKLSDVFLRDLPPVPVLNPAAGLNFGAGTIDTPSLPLAATLGNAGWSPLVVGSARITGADAGQFGVVADGCRLKTLRRAQACTVSVVFEPRGPGARTATLAISDNFQGSPRTVRLRGSAARVPEAKLEISPEIGKPGIVTIASGRGFPANTEVRLRWSMGISPKLARITTDAQGRFVVPVLVFHNDRTGPRQLLAEPAVTGAFAPATADMLVTKPTVIPPRFGSLRIIDVPLVLVIRG